MDQSGDGPGVARGTRLGRLAAVPWRGNAVGVGGGELAPSGPVRARTPGAHLRVNNLWEHPEVTVHDR
jgi:hypothetical protein